MGGLSLFRNDLLKIQLNNYLDNNLGMDLFSAGEILRVRIRPL